MPRQAALRLVAAAALVVSTVSAEPVPAPAVRPAAVVGYLEQTIRWYQSVTDAEQERDVAGDMVSGARLHESGVQALQLGFDAARAEAALLRGAATPANAAAPRPASNFEELSARLAARAAALEAKQADVNTALAHAAASKRAALVAQRDAIAADLQLVKTMQGNIDQILRFATTAQAVGAAEDSLSARIAALERTVPEAQHTQAARARAAANAVPASGSAPAAAEIQPFQPESAGVVALAAELVRLATVRRQLTSLLRSTDALMQSLDAQRAPLTADMREIVRIVDAASAAPEQGAADATGQQDLQGAVARARQISTALVPLGEQGVVVGDARGTLVDARSRVAAHAGTVARYLAIRLFFLLVAIAAVLVVSEAWRRGTFRYLRDVRRRRQFLLVRRILVTVAIVFVLVGGFVSQLGSLATYAGFVTAGVAVALQNVILAVVAYFFLIGRYGVRVGDRITIGGVTGSVIEIGLVRIYLMELAPPEWLPTGRIVVFSNAVLFQPAALFKQMPGVDYLWHTVTLTLAATADLARAEKEIRAAVETAYEEFRGSIERQHAAFQESVDVQTPVPQPEVEIRFADEGAVLQVRYPVERSRATATDNRVLTAIRAAIAKPPTIPLAPAGAPKLQRAAG